MSKYKIGDRVKSIIYYDGYELRPGMIGTIHKFHEGSIGVIWDEYVEGHELSDPYLCPEGHGLYVAENDIELYSEVEFKLEESFNIIDLF